ncbi:putative aminophospholipid-translocase [Mycoblastus sanguinarius]|nr:putative aminophospholipid-translocase [Mycoblastus sanguinarius]
MSRAHQYHQPNAPDSPDDDSESDVEHDLQELDPATGTYDRHSKHERMERQIPLRSLRAGRTRGFGRQKQRYDASDGREDLQGLLDENAEQRDSAGSYGDGVDDTPLLHTNGGGMPVVYPDEGRGGFLSSHLRLPSFISSQSGPEGPRGEDNRAAQGRGTARNINIGQYPPPRFPPNAVSNAKYTAWSFLPRTLYNEFSFFFNMYFLFVALSQIIPSLRIGYLSTYIAPLAFVLAITLGKEALDDIARRRRDAEANKEEYTVLQLRDRSHLLKSKGKKKGSSRLQSKRVRVNESTKRTRLDAIEEEEENVGDDSQDAVSNIEVDEIDIKSRDIKVGDVLKLGKDQRVPADLVILKSYSADSSIAASLTRAPQQEPSGETGPLMSPVEEPPIADISISQTDPKRSISPDKTTSSVYGGDVGETFIRTDQLDGETDWKLRLAPPLTQSLDPRNFTRLKIVAGKPSKEVNEFVGTVDYARQNPQRTLDGNGAGVDQNITTCPLTIDNTAWANTVLASNATVLAVVVYTGAQTRQALSTSPSRSKAGLLEHEINNLTKILCALTLTLSIVLVAVRGIEGRPGQEWYVAVMRFLILFSTIVPISLRVNLDMGKTVYARFIEKDQDIPGTVVRTSTIPEELGRIEYLLSDKTGTLTQNEMDLKKIHVGTVSYANEAMDEVRSYVRQGFSVGVSSDATQLTSLITPSSTYNANSSGPSTTRTRREIGSRVRDLVLALALCHNVTPSTEDENGHSITTYQASSPDEIAIVRWAENVGLRLLHRDRHTVTLQSVDTSRVVVRVKILEVFPFTSAGKRMGIILQFNQGLESTISSAAHPAEIWFYQKGADTVMTSIVAANDWLDEETANMAREGLRTLVVGRKKLSAHQYQDFSAFYKQASMSLQNRDTSMVRVVRDHLEHNLELLGVTGVEDKLQKDVKPSLELLRNAGIKIWMLTGDKVETARCVAVSAKLVSRTQYIHAITNLSSTSGPSAALDALSLLRSKPGSTALLIDGDSLSHFLNYHRSEFISLAVLLPAVIACRCSPTQKADIATLIRHFTRKRVLCIGDGGNDVSMIQAADVGVGIVGKEGRQASLAADFSITSFHHLTKLLVWHGRNSYKRSAKLAQFVIHRGLIISVCQTFYSIATQLQPHALYRDWLLVGYATVYTMAPVFSLVLDKDVDEGLANLYPELYKELTTGKSLSYRTFFVWVAVSIYQGGIIQGLSQILVNLDSERMVSVSFTVLVINELIMVAFEIVTWHWIMGVTIVGTMGIYVGSVPFLGGYFDLDYVWSWAFAWRVAAISAISLIPPYSIKVLRRTLKPPNYRKVQGL